jgi:hypothetical protein
MGASRRSGGGIGDGREDPSSEGNEIPDVEGLVEQGNFRTTDNGCRSRRIHAGGDNHGSRSRARGAELELLEELLGINVLKMQIGDDEIGVIGSQLSKGIATASGNGDSIARRFKGKAEDPEDPG